LHKVKVTLIIPTHERHDYLDRSLYYYKQIKLVDFPIIIVDSSFKAFEKIDYADVTYLHLPHRTLSEKLSIATSCIASPYSLLCADDDFIIPETLFKCVDFLEEHRDFSSAQGKYVSFHNIRGSIFFKPYYLYNSRMNVNSDTISERLLEQFTPYMHQSYSVFRTEELKDGFQRFAHTIYDFTLLELSTAIDAVINGKHKIFNDLYSARESIFASSSSRCKTFEAIKKDAEYHEFLDIHAKKITSKIPIDLKDAKQLIIDGLNKYEVFIEESQTIRMEYSMNKYMIEFSKSSRNELKFIERVVKKYNIPNRCNLTFKECFLTYLSILLPEQIKHFLHKLI